MSSMAQVLAAALFVLSSACAPPRVGPHGPYDPAPVVTVVHVANRGYSDVVVYLADGNTPFRLGTVAALGRASLRIPNQLAGAGVRLLVRTRHSGQLYATDPVLAGAGGVLALTVQPLLIASEVSVISYGALER